jgi:hypothetical protein
MEQGKFRISDFGFRIEKINPKSETLNLGPQSAFRIPSPCGISLLANPP